MPSAVMASERIRRPRGTFDGYLAWRPDASGFFYAARHEPGELTPGDESSGSAIYEHRLGAGAPPAKLASRGNSNGGLLVAVTAMQAPEAFGAVFCRVPILDMLRFQGFSNTSGATVEYGSPDDPVEGPYLAGYSPYHNIRADRRYPAMTFVSALNDRVAPPHDPLKMLARLQAEATQGGPFLLLPLRDSGHGGGTTLTRTHRTGRRRAQLLLLGTRRRTALARLDGPGVQP